MKILVTGSLGYIGAILCAMLRRAGHEVIGYDAGFYQQGLLYNTTEPLPLTIIGDIRDLSEGMLRSFALQGSSLDAIVHLAELSNDPLGQNDRAVTLQINHEGSVRLAEAAIAAGVRRFIYTSSSSVYGATDGEGDMTEESPVNPQTAYAECKVFVERDVAKLARDDFSPVFLRNATAFGPSPRIRFDIVLNDLAALAHAKKRIEVKSDGTPWRPLVHVRDICQAIMLALIAPKHNVHNHIFNVGSDEQNYQVRQLADIIGKVFPDCVTTYGDNAGDNRSYRISCAKIRKHMPQFVPLYSAQRGAEELRDIFKRINFTLDDYKARPFKRLTQIKWLLETGQLDGSLRWT